MTNITGATVNTGFKGIMGLFSRNSLMAFESDINSSVRFTRRDTNESVDVIYDPSSIGADSMMRELMQKSISRTATAEEEKEFGRLWQQRVEAISKNIDKVIKIA